jgi:PAS domain S-box-containing protein
LRLAFRPIDFLYIWKVCSMNASASNDGSSSAAVALAEQFRVIAEIGGDIAFSIDCASGQLRYVSPAIEQLVGYTPAEVAAGLRPGEDGPLAALCAGLPERMRRLGAGDRSRLRLVREAEFQGAHGYPVPVEIISSVLCDAAGLPQALVGLVRDLSPRRLREAEQKRFASMLNHEFRTPLSTIDGAIQRLEATCAHADEATRARYRKIAVATDRLIAMLDDYLSPERMAGIGSTRQPTSLAPRALLEEGLEQLRAAGRVASIKTRELPPTLRCEPEGQCHRLFSTDLTGRAGRAPGGQRHRAGRARPRPRRGPGRAGTRVRQVLSRRQCRRHARQWPGAVHGAFDRRSAWRRAEPGHPVRRRRRVSHLAAGCRRPAACAPGSQPR